ncbi:MAG: hypothetical protein FWB94_06950 [Chitinispirillia bacterium]|nr:hypothetical protein [Chitinispirillia bacterium]
MGTPDTRWYADAIAANPKVTNFTISTADELAGLAEIVNLKKDNFSGKNIMLAGNIDLSAYENWVPIGIYANDEAKSFSGTFDGFGHTISRLTINSQDSHKGLFGFICSGKVKNLGLECIVICGGDHIGGLAGGIGNYASLTACYSTGAVKGTDKIGGLVGNVSNNSNITACYSICTVTAASRAGGLAGAVSYSDLAGCAALNPEVKGNGLHGRVAASVDSRYAVSNNIAFSDMQRGDGTSKWQRKGAGAVDGADITAASIKSDPTLGGRFTPADGWTTEPGGLPGLGGRPAPMPEHLTT